MPTLVRCPICKARFEPARARSSRGVLCPECLNVVMPDAVADDEPEPEVDQGTYGVQTVEPNPEGDYDDVDDESSNGETQHRRRDDQGRGRRTRIPRGAKAQQFRLTYLGLTVHFAKVIVSIFGVFIWFGASMMRSFEQGTLPILMTVLSILVSSSTILLGLTGSAFCCQVPRGTRARAFIIASFVVDASSAGLFLISVFFFVLAGLGASASLVWGSMGFELLSHLATFAGLILFLLFLKQLAYYLGENALGDRAGDPIIYVVTVVAGAVIGTIVLGVLALWFRQVPYSRLVLIVLGFGLLAVSLVKLLFMIINVLSTIRNVLGKRLAASRELIWDDIPAWAWWTVPLTAILLLASVVVLTVVVVNGSETH